MEGSSSPDRTLDVNFAKIIRSSKINYITISMYLLHSFTFWAAQSLVRHKETISGTPPFVSTSHFAVEDVREQPELLAHQQALRQQALRHRLGDRQSCPEIPVGSAAPGIRVWDVCWFEWLFLGNPRNEKAKDEKFHGAFDRTILFSVFSNPFPRWRWGSNRWKDS